MDKEKKDFKSIKIKNKTHEYLKIRAAKEGKKIYELIEEIIKKEKEI